MEAIDFRHIADHLLACPPKNKEEAAERTAVNRLYYAAYIHARDVMRSWGCSLGVAGGHSQVFEGLKCSGVRDIIEIGHKIAELFSERLSADYKTEQPRGFDVQKLRLLHEHVVEELGCRWSHLTSAERSEALDKIQRRVTSIEERSRRQ